MSLFLILIIFCLAMALHELGHAFAMKRNNVPIKKICLVGFGPKICEFRLTRWFGDTPIEIRAIPIGASVTMGKVGNKEIELTALPFRTAMEIFSAGIIANFASAFACLIIPTIYKWYEIGELMRGVLWSLLLLTITFVLLKYQRWIALFIPLVGIAMFGIILYAIFFNNVPTTTVISGPIETVEVFHKMQAKKDGFIDAWKFASVLSLALGLSNSLPFLPFDGGHTLNGWIQKIIGHKRYNRFKTAITTSLLAPGLLLIVFAIGRDIYLSMLKLFS